MYKQKCLQRESWHMVTSNCHIASQHVGL